MFDRLFNRTRLIRTVLKKQTFSTEANTKKVLEVGKFSELPNAEYGKVVVRFPPDANGYLHIGHAKAAFLNEYYQKLYNGKLILRIDDTNSVKENACYEEIVKEDLALLQVNPNICTYSSDYFGQLLELCEKMLQDGRAYIDDSDAETTRRERYHGIDSKNRDNSVTRNLEMWNEMKEGTSKGQQCCARIKIDMKHRITIMRDPIIYRCKVEKHPRTGDKYKVYPTYDFACPIIDSLEGVTHTLRSLEYKDWKDQYYFICEVLGLRKPHVGEFSRLNMLNTVMSKRQLSLLVDNGFVDGWDDPRMPTVRGVIRRGLNVDALRRFIIELGSSRNIMNLDWCKLWSYNKKLIDPLAPRYVALECATATSSIGEDNLVPVKIREPIHEEAREIRLFDKLKPASASRELWFGQNLLLEQIDAAEMNEGDTVSLMNWGNVKIVEIKKENNRITEIIVDMDLDNKDFKTTMKVTWLCNSQSANNIPVKALYYDHLITKEVLAKNDDLLEFVNRNSLTCKHLIGESALAHVKKGDIVQLLRKGNFICDQVWSRETPLTLIAIPG